MTAVAADLAARLDAVDGWFHLDEALALHAEVAARRGPLHIVEIGSWKGRSTIAMAAALEEIEGGGEIVAIDPHTGSVEHHEMWGEVDTYAEFLANIEGAGLAHRVRPVRAFAHDARPDHGEPIDVLFIDGSHEYEDVAVDIADWAPLVRDGGALVLNDTSWPGVHRAVLESVLWPGGPWRAGRLVRSTLFLEHRPDAPWTRRDSVQLHLLKGAMVGRRQAGRVVEHLPAPVKAAGNRLTGALTSSR